jgi:hypothetical protein
MRPEYILKTDLYDYLTDAIARVHAEKGKGPVARISTATLEAVIYGLQLRPGAKVTIIRDE